MARRRDLHRLATRGGAQIEDFGRVSGNESRGQRGSKILNPPPSCAEAREVGDRARVFEANVTGREGFAAILLGERLGFVVARKAEVERRTLGDLPSCRGNRRAGSC